MAVDVKGRAAGSITLRSAAMTSAASWTRHLSAEASAVAPDPAAPREALAADQRTFPADLTTTPLLRPIAGVVAAVALAEQHTSPGAVRPAPALSRLGLCYHSTMRYSCQSLVAEPKCNLRDWSKISWRKDHMSDPHPRKCSETEGVSLSTNV